MRLSHAHSRVRRHCLLLLLFLFLFCFFKFDLSWRPNSNTKKERILSTVLCFLSVVYDVLSDDVYIERESIECSYVLLQSLECEFPFTRQRVVNE